MKNKAAQCLRLFTIARHTFLTIETAMPIASGFAFDCWAARNVSISEQTPP